MTDKAASLLALAERVEALLPCPFCGGDAYANKHFWQVAACKKCAAEGPASETKAAAIAAWNARAAMQPAITAAEQRGAEQERARIVAWLRQDASHGAGNVFEHLADAIENQHGGNDAG